jgi:hypothetical protein
MIESRNLYKDSLPKSLQVQGLHPKEEALWLSLYVGVLSQTLNQDVVFANLYSFHLIKTKPTIQYYQELAILWIHEVQYE